MRRLDAACLALVLVLGAPRALADGLRDTAERTRGVIVQRLAAQERGLRDRVRTLYKLTAFGDLPLWVDEGARSGELARRGAARRVILRDLEERRLLTAELAAVDADLARVAAAEARARELAALSIPPMSLVRPADGPAVADYGPYRDGAVRLVRRGIELSARGREVVAAGAGQVSWAGPLRGLGTTVVVDHGQGLVTITSGLASARVTRGDRVDAGQPLGRAAGPRIRFEVRRGGRPVDPVPLLRAK
jgi:murein DD-endopeptidase MepM/ murein hydrolase activator NlpD